MNKPYNFFSGPAVLPEEVLLQAAAAIQDFAGTKLSILEISHRNKAFVAVMEEARLLVKKLMNLSNDKEVLFLQGGASLQFLMVPFNLLSANETAAYFNTGQWSDKAIEEAKNFGNVEVIASSKHANYSFIPKEWIAEKIMLGKSYAYVHITTNNTIFGTQWSDNLINELFAQTSAPIVADMSSDIFSRKIDFNRFDLIYAGAQKNMGPAGATLVVVNKNLLGKKNGFIPTLLDYQKQIDAASMLNTPSVFAVYVAMLTLRWIENKGLDNLEDTNNQKAALLYKAIENSTVFTGTVAKQDRSKMNVCFKTKDAETDAKFLAFAEANNLVGLAGYRTVGGFRASIYNAMPMEGVEKLVDCMKKFEIQIK
jgi:phosphoserine aminotransferase